MSRTNTRTRTITTLAMAALLLTTFVGTALAANGKKVAPPAQTLTTPAVTPVTVSDPKGPEKVRSETIDGSIGGEVKWGRFRVTVPPGAWYGAATVTLTVPSPSVLECELSIDPGTANGFSVPVVLTVNTPGNSGTGPLSMGWFDPAQGKWVRVTGSQDDPIQKVVTAPLYHFSKYGVFDTGRAGW